MQAVRDLLTPQLLPEPIEPAPARRRRRLVVAATLAAGTVALAATLAAPRGSLAFSLLGFLLAAIWVAGSTAAGPLHLSRSTDRTESRRSLLAAIVLGGLAFVAFVGASLVARHVPGLDGAIESVLATVDAGPRALVLAIAVVNAVAEERFFRGALPVALVGDHRAAVATAVYVLVTVATLNIALVVAAAAMGTVFMLERLATRGTLAPTLTHITWSILVLLALPGWASKARSMTPAPENRSRTGEAVAELEWSRGSAPIVAVCLPSSWEGGCRLEGPRDDEEGEMSYQDRPTPSEPATDDLGGRIERPRPEQGTGPEDASAADRARETASTGKEKAREVASTTSAQARKVASTTQDEAHEVVRGVNEQARRLAGDTRQELRSQANAQVDRLAQGLNDVSRQLRSMGENGEPGAVSDMTREAAARTQEISERLRGGGIDGVLGQLRSVGRNRPGLFLFGAFGVGLVAGRVVRNLAQEPSDNGSADIGPSGGRAPSRSVETGYDGSPATGASQATPWAQDYEALPTAPGSNEARGG